MNKKILILIASIIILSKLTHALVDGDEWPEQEEETHIARIREEEAEAAKKRLTTAQIQKEAKKLKDELYELEGQIFYTKHLSPLIPIRERTAFMICIAGILGSSVAPFKLVPSSPGHPNRVLAKRARIAVGTLAASLTTAFGLTYVRPILWLKENKKKRLETKIFELKNT